MGFDLRVCGKYVLRRKDSGMLTYVYDDWNPTKTSSCEKTHTPATVLLAHGVRPKIVLGTART